MKNNTESFSLDLALTHRVNCLRAMGGGGRVGVSLPTTGANGGCLPRCPTWEAPHTLSSCLGTLPHIMGLMCQDCRLCSQNSRMKGKPMNREANGSMRRLSHGCGAHPGQKLARQLCFSGLISGCDSPDPRLCFAPCDLCYVHKSQTFHPSVKMYSFSGESRWLIHSEVKTSNVIPFPEQVWGLEEAVEQDTVGPGLGSLCTRSC